VLFRITILLWALWIGASAHAQVASAPEPRAFTSVEVVGNSRFDDRDIFATAGLDLSRPIGEPELRAAMEALYFTGEFRHVRLSSDGDTLIIAVDEEPEFQGGLTFGLGYDTDLGAIGLASLALQDVFAPGVVITGELSFSRDQREISIGAFKDDVLAPNVGLGFRFRGIDADHDEDLFSYREFEVSPYLTYRFAERTHAELRYVYRSTDIFDVSAGASPIIAGEAGELAQSGIGLRFVTSGQLTALSWGLAFDQELTGLGGDTALSVTRLRLSGDLAIGESGLRVRSVFDAGHVEGLDGDRTRVVDRFVLGGASFRGFDGASIAPRDVTATDSQVLGGTDFAVLRTDIVLPLAPQFPNLETFVFADVGSVWGLDSDTVPAGTVDADQTMRSSVGLGLSLDTELGRFEAYYALGTDDLEQDETRAFGLTIRSQF